MFRVTRHGFKEMLIGSVVLAAIGAALLEYSPIWESDF